MLVTGFDVVLVRCFTDASDVVDTDVLVCVRVCVCV